MTMPQLCSAPDFDERWLEPGAVVPVIPPNMGAALREIQRLRDCLSEKQTDAARYRWLRSRYVALEFCYGRDDDNEQEGHPAIVLSVPMTSAWPLPWPGVPVEKFDQSIDRCIALEAPK